MCVQSTKAAPAGLKRFRVAATAGRRKVEFWPLAHAEETYGQLSPPEFSSLILIQHSREDSGRFLGALISCDKAHLGRVRNRRFFVVVEHERDCLEVSLEPHINTPA